MFLKFPTVPGLLSFQAMALERKIARLNSTEIGLSGYFVVVLRNGADRVILTQIESHVLS
jgi:hypothetical protein